MSVSNSPQWDMNTHFGGRRQSQQEVPCSLGLQNCPCSTSVEHLLKDTSEIRAPG